MMHRYLLESREFVPGADLPLSDRGFRYGMSVFETIAIRNRRALFLEAHLRKLDAAIERVRFRPPLEWRDAAVELLSTAPIDEGLARIYVTAGDGGANLEVARSRVALMLEPIDIPAPEHPAECRALCMPFIPQLPPGKTGNYWPNLIAHAHVGDAQAILLTPEGTVLSGAMANLFVVMKDRLVTPQSHGDIRLGVVHNWIVSHYDVHEAHLTISDLEQAQDAFLTNSRIGILRIANLDEEPLLPHPLVDEVWRHYRSEVLDVCGR